MALVSLRPDAVCEQRPHHGAHVLGIVRLHFSDCIAQEIGSANQRIRPLWITTTTRTEATCMAATRIPVDCGSIRGTHSSEPECHTDRVPLDNGRIYQAAGAEIPTYHGRSLSCLRHDALRTGVERLREGGDDRRFERLQALP